MTAIGAALTPRASRRAPAGFGSLPCLRLGALDLGARSGHDHTARAHHRATSTKFATHSRSATHSEWEKNIQGLLKAIDGLNEWTGRVVAAATVFIVLFTVYDVGSRAFFSRPTDWAFEVTKQLYALHFMMLGGYALLHRGHVEVDIFKEQLSRRGQALLDVLGYLIFFLPFLAVLLYSGITFAARAWRFGETTYGILAIPVYPIKTVIVVAAVLVALQALATFLRALRALKGAEDDGPRDVA